MTDSIGAPVGVGIVGLGRSGWKLHAATVAALPELYQLVAVVDLISERSREARASFGCAVYPDIAALASDERVELVVIATPSHRHADDAVEALEHGKHVLVEKPFCQSLAEFDQVSSAARRAQRLAVASQNLRYAGDFLKVRDVIRSGCLGTIVQISIHRHAFRRRWDWQTLSRFGGGMLNNDASHIIDQALLLLSHADVDVTCSMARTPLSLGDAEDHVKILLSAPDQPLVDLEFSNACAFPQDQWLVLGTNGCLTGTSTKLRWRYLDEAEMPVRRVRHEPPQDRSYDDEVLPWIEESCDLLHESYVTSHRRLYRRLFSSLRLHEPLEITLSSVRSQVAILERCRAERARQIGAVPT